MNVAGWRFKGFNEKKYRFKPGGQFGKGVPPGCLAFCFISSARGLTCLLGAAREHGRGFMEDLGHF